MGKDRGRGRKRNRNRKRKKEGLVFQYICQVHIKHSIIPIFYNSSYFLSIFHYNYGWDAHNSKGFCKMAGSGFASVYTNQCKPVVRKFSSIKQHKKFGNNKMAVAAPGATEYY